MQVQLPDWQVAFGPQSPQAASGSGVQASASEPRGQVSVEVASAASDVPVVSVVSVCCVVSVGAVVSVRAVSGVAASVGASPVSCARGMQVPPETKTPPPVMHRSESAH